MFKAVLFDFGGVITTSPFDAFTAYEKEISLPDGIIRKINSTNPDSNAWAKFERNDVQREEFKKLFEKEAAALGHKIDANRVLECLQTTIRPRMVQLVKELSREYITAILTNNLQESSDDQGQRATQLIAHVSSVADYVSSIIESSKLGVRKPERLFYEIACKTLQVEPKECVFLDDLGINLKPAKEMGMTTIKVINEQQALDELTDVLSRR